MADLEIPVTEEQPDSQPKPLFTPPVTTKADALSRMYRSQPVSPDAYSRAQVLSRKTGLPAETAFNSAPEAEYLAAQPDWAGFSERAGRISQRASENPALFHAIKDDTKSVEELEQAIFGKGPAQDASTGAAAKRGAMSVGLFGEMGGLGIDRALTAVGSMFLPEPRVPYTGKGEVDATSGGVTASAKQAVELYNALPHDKRIEVATALANQAAANGETIGSAGEFLGYVARNPGALWTFTVEMGVSAAGGGGVGGFAVKPLAAKASAEWGKRAITGAGVAVGSNFMGAAPAEFAGNVAQGMDVGAAAGKATVKAGVEALVNAPFGALAAGLPVGSTLAGKTANVFGQAGAQAVGGGAGAAAAAAAVGEQITVGELLAETLLEGTTIVTDIPTVAFTSAVEERGKAEKAKKLAAYADNLIKRSEATKLRERDPETFQALVDDLTAENNGGEPQKLYIDAEDLGDVLNQSGVTLEQFEEAMPSLRGGKVAAAILDGGMVEIPVGEMAAYLKETNVNQEALVQHLRDREDGMSAVEADEFFQNEQKQMQDLATKILDDKKTTDEFRGSAQKVYDSIREQLVAAKPAGLTGKAADKYSDAAALLWRDFYTVQAKKMGVTPEQLYNEMGVMVSGAKQETPAGQQVIEQGEVDTRTPEFKAWSENFPVVSEQGHDFKTGEGVVVRAYHGSSEGGIKRATKGETFASMDPAVASVYALDDTGAGDYEPQRVINPIFMRMKNPMVLDGQGYDWRMIPFGGGTINMNTLVREAKRRGHDGIIVKNVVDGLGSADAPPSTVVATLGKGQIKSVFNERPTSNPDILKQEVDTRSEAFKAWFSDSKVVDDAGKPMVVYHGSPQAGFQEFEGGPFFFSDRYDIAASHAGGHNDVEFAQEGAEFYDEQQAVYSTYLAINNPLEVDFAGRDWGVGPEGLKLDDWANRAKRMGHDGLIVRNVVDTGWRAAGLVADKGVGDVFVAFRPEQIKSVSNRGTFDPNSSDILEQRGKVRPVPESLDATASLESTMQMADDGHYKRNRDLKVAMQERTAKAAKEAKVDLTSNDAATRDYLVRIGVQDALFALQSNANAVGWYDKTVSKALAIVALVHPEIATDPDAKLAFTWALAVTSNGIKVDKNFQLAEQAYAYYKANGVMPTNIQAGNAQKAINESLGLFNTLRERFGVDLLRKIVESKFTVAQMNEIGLEVGGENTGTVVRGAAILGPKIGNGFFSNLNGFFDQLTMDRWLMRTWGRWTGTLIDARPDMVKAKRAELKELVKRIKADPDSGAAKAFDAVLGSKLGVGDLDALAVAIQKASMKPANRELMNKLGTPFEKGGQLVTPGEELRKVGNALAKYLDGQKEAPTNGTERSWIRHVFAGILDELHSKGYDALTMSDLQALLWYPERRLYDKAKSADDVSAGYEDDEAPDYANAAAGLARALGVTDDAIKQAIAEVENATDQRAANAGRSPVENQGAAAEGNARAAADGTSESRGLVGRERKRFLQRHILVAERIGRAGDAKAWRYSGGSRAAADRARGVKARFKATVRWRNLLTNAEIQTQDIVELEPTEANAANFHAAISASKVGAKFGAAVYVYPSEEYRAMRLFTTEDGKSGFAIKPDGDIVSVFSDGGGKVDALLGLAVEQGGTKLDAFNTVLPEIYSIAGFREVAREEWNETHKPEGWDKETFKQFNNGEPAVVYMVYDPAYSPFEPVGEQDEYRQSPRSADGEYQQDGNRGGRPARRGLAPLEGAPAVRGFHGPDPQLVAVAEQYARDNGIPVRRQAEYVEVDGDLARRLAAAYDAMPHAPQDPAVKEAYENLIRQTLAQYRALEAAGYRFWFADISRADNAEYLSTPWNAMRDIRANKTMGVFPTEGGFGSGASELNVDDNPLLADTGITWPVGDLNGQPQRVLANDLFRAVHDAFGHGLEGAGFRARGEENAWQAHSRLFTGSALAALTSETRGQNSWLNFGPYGEANENAKVEDTVFADQKTGLLPEWAWTEGIAEDEVLPAPFRDYPTLVREQAMAGERAKLEKIGVEATDERVATMAGDVKPRTDETTGAYFLEARMPIVAEALRVAREQDKPAVYATMDLANLGGLNKAGGAGDVNEFILKPVADIIRAALSTIGAESVQLIRQGGDELSAVVVGADRAAVDAALADASRIFEERVAGQLREKVGKTALTEINNPKGGPAGTTIYRVVQPMNGTADAERFIKAADALVELEKAKRKGELKDETVKVELGFEPIDDQRTIDEVLAEAVRAAGSRGGQGRGAVAGGDVAGGAAPGGVGDSGRGGVVEQGPRGTFNPRTLTIRLLEASDLSTFLHESGHAFLEMTFMLAARENAPADVKRDAQILLDWFGVADVATWLKMSVDEKRAHHEKFALSFERYLFTGKAPSIELVNAFGKFRDWLTSVYTSMKKFLNDYPESKELNPEIREVMDRMLATDQQIAEAEQARSLLPLLEDPESSGLSAEELAEYHADAGEGHADAVRDLEARRLRDLKWGRNARSTVLKELQKDVAEKRAAMRKRVADEIREQPVYAALHFLRTGKFDAENLTNTQRKVLEIAANSNTKLSLQAVKEMYGENDTQGPWRKLPAGKNGVIGNDGGLHPDEAALLFGFRNGYQLIEELANADDFDQVVDAATDQRMLIEYGDITSDAALNKAADQAIHNAAYARMLATELDALDKLANPRKVVGTDKKGRKRTVNLVLKAAKEFAVAKIGRLKIRDVKPLRYTASEARAGRAARDAHKKGDVVLAAAEKRNQVLQHSMSKEAYKALEEIEKGYDYLRKFEKEGTRKNLDVDYLDQIDAILERFEIRQRSNKELDRRKSLAEWMAEQEQLGLVPDIPAEVANERNVINYKEMTVEEFRGLVDSIKQIEHLGRLKKKLLTAKDKREFEAVRDEIAAQIRESAGGRKVSNIKKNEIGNLAKWAARWWFAWHRKVASIGRELDGFKDGGPVWNYIIRSMNEAGDREAAMREKATVDLMKMLEPVLKAGRLGGRGVYIQSIGDWLNREQILGVALNVGNAGNLQRLMDGEGWSSATVQEILSNLTKEDLAFVQKVWDYFDAEFRPLIAEKERRVSGKEPEWVEAQPFTVQLKDGETVSLKGGYFPIVYDTNRSARAQQGEAADIAKRQLSAAYTAATTRRSFTKERAKEVTGRPLMRGLDGLWRGVEEVTHDLTHHEWLIDANRLLRDPEISSAIIEGFGAEYYKTMTSAVEDIATGDQQPQKWGERPMNHIRTGATIVGLGLNVMTAALQVTGYSNSWVRIGGAPMARGLKTYLKAPLRAANEVYAKSTFMRLRAKTMNREISEIRNRVDGKSSARIKLDVAAFAMIAKMQTTVDVPTWLGAYEKAMAEMTGSSMTDEEIEAKAVAMADQAVVDAQGGGQIKDLAAVQKGSAFAKLFTNFYSYFNTALNLGIERTKATNFRKGGEVAALARDYLILYSLPAVAGMLIKDALKDAMGAGGDDDEKYWRQLPKRLAGEQISYLLGLFVLSRELSPAVQYAVGATEDGARMYGYTGTAGTRLFAEATKLGQQAGQVREKGDEQLDMALFKALSSVVGIAAHLPTGQLNRTVDGAVALIDGSAENPGVLVVGAPR